MVFLLITAICKHLSYSWKDTKVLYSSATCARITTNTHTLPVCPAMSAAWQGASNQHDKHWSPEHCEVLSQDLHRQHLMAAQLYSKLHTAKLYYAADEV